MAKAKKTPGQPAGERIVTVSPSYMRDDLKSTLREGDKIAYVGLSGLDIERVEKVPAAAAKVTLEMTEEEADFLRDLLAGVGGSPSASRRKHSDAIIRALVMAGVCGHTTSDLDGRIMFEATTF